MITYDRTIKLDCSNLPCVLVTYDLPCTYVFNDAAYKNNQACIKCVVCYKLGPSYLIYNTVSRLNSNLFYERNFHYIDHAVYLISMVIAFKACQ